MTGAIMVGVFFCATGRSVVVSSCGTPHDVTREVQRLAEGSRCSIRMLNTRPKLIGAGVVVVKQIAELCRIT